MPHLSRDGVKLYYEESGAGDPPIVFVHGWCCDRTYHAPQVAHFSRNHRCVTLDLRGHGRSDAPAGGYTVPAFADDVAWLCDQIGLRKPLIVGHSMGGAIALSLAASHPDLPSAIVLLDGAVFPPAPLLAMATALNPAFHSPAYADALAAVFDQMFMPTDDPGRKAAIMAGARSVPQHVVAGEWDAIWSNDWAGDAAACALPIMYVGSHAPVADMTRLREAMPSAILAQTAGAGHFHQLEVPEQVNAMIDRFLAVNRQ
ncbi:MAG TPA: alpha/beta hydrolase [Dehalococcoidia bacterium]|nr:alpha/beta hydrolase [Dehalococcoidia bacterium]